jgi:hypothetical protein
MWSRIRLGVLLLILLFVALSAWFDRHYATEWNNALRVSIFPIDADGSATTAQYIRSLRSDEFEDIEAFFGREASHYRLALDVPIRFTLAPQLSQRPPEIAADASGLSVMLWSLRTRFWAWRVDGPPGTEVKLFVLYHDPQRSPRLPHSLGLQKGLFGIVHVFADRSMDGSNATVIAHELLHTLGATDKYRMDDNLPQYPDGFAEPDRAPLYPQAFAELMAGRIPLDAHQARMPTSLEEVVIGTRTAQEIGWVKQ